MTTETATTTMRHIMDELATAQRRFVSQAPEIIPFPGPHYGVHIRQWESGPGITIECDPGYCGIGAALTAAEARGLGEALIRAADTMREEGEEMTNKKRIDDLEARLDGLTNDARYWDLIRTYGEYSRQVLQHLEACAEIQARGENHT